MNAVAQLIHYNFFLLPVMFVGEPKETDEDSEITQLLKNYAENDEHYEGFELISPANVKSDGSIDDE